MSLGRLGQADGYWPCRSRSYLMEMLHFIIYSYIEAAPGSGALTGDRHDPLAVPEIVISCRYY